MKRTEMLASSVAIMTLVTGTAMAGALNSTLERGPGAAHPLAPATQELATKPFPQHSWERGAILEVMQEKSIDNEGASGSATKSRWERGQMLELLKQKSINRPRDRSPANSPRVVIYMDQTATEPGLPRTLGNTNASRSIMLEYLEQARSNDPSS